MLRVISDYFFRKKEQNGVAFKKPYYSEMEDFVPNSCFIPNEGSESWHSPVMISAKSIAKSASSIATLNTSIKLLQTISRDEYSNYVLSYYHEGIKRFCENWYFLDIVNVIIALSDTLQPRRYLEVGVRCGRSACAVASAAPSCDMFLFDMWVEDYAGMRNPGPDFVRSELKKVGHQGRSHFINGDSHKTLPVFLDCNPSLSFDLITVDGDHSPEGAAQDLRDALPRLAIGGAVVFDDICHPAHPGLKDVWNQMVCMDPRYSCHNYIDTGFGVGFAIRKS